MLTLHSAQAQPRRARAIWRRRIATAARSLSAWLRATWRHALALDGPPEPPSPVPPIPRAGALREGAVLFERSGAAISDKRVA